METPRTVSVILPAFQSAGTIRACLQALREQTHPPLEVIVVDSSPDDSVAAAVADFPEMVFIQSAERLKPHSARNRGVALAHGDLIAFTDPDIVQTPDWLERMVAAHEQHGGVIVGALACAECGWLDMGIHLFKFNAWLPTGRAGPTDFSPTGSMLIPRAVFDQVGSMADDITIADALYSWQLLDAGYTLWFCPEAWGSHHNDLTLGAFVRSCSARGGEFAALRADYYHWGKGKLLVTLLISVLPVRLVHFLMRVGRNASEAGMRIDFLRTIPILALGHAAWLAGEVGVYLRRLLPR